MTLVEVVSELYFNKNETISKPLALAGLLVLKGHRGH